LKPGLPRECLQPHGSILPGTARFAISVSLFQHPGAFFPPLPLKRRGFQKEGIGEEKSLRQDKRSLPEPDVVVAVGRSGDYRPQSPSASEVPLIVEVCHHTQKADFQDKYRRYAATWVPVYWILDLHHRRIEVFTRPVGQRTMASYSTSISYSEGGTVPVLLLGKEIGVIHVADFMPPSVSTS
jgi:Putative restriction endonuclease